MALHDHDMTILTHVHEFLFVNVNKLYLIKIVPNVIIILIKKLSKCVSASITFT